MIKRTLFFGNPAYLSTHNEQLIVRLPEVENNTTLPSSFKKEATATIPIEDIGFVIIEHKQIIITHALLQKLIENNVAVVSCNDTHLPNAMFLNLAGNKTHSERFDLQLNASEPLKKQLWQQTITAKIKNQALHLQQKGFETENILYWANNVKSGDTDNLEGRAAAYYWANIFSKRIQNFKRSREGEEPNNLLNYGYAILRAVVARSLVASGLLPIFGIHHHNKYNAYPLADDIMEPYRPFVDKLVCELIEKNNSFELTTAIKKEMLIIPAMDVFIDEEKSPLMIATMRSCSSLVKCLDGSSRKLLFPVFQ